MTNRVLTLSIGKLQTQFSLRFIIHLDEKKNKFFQMKWKHCVAVWIRISHVKFCTWFFDMHAAVTVHFDMMWCDFCFMNFSCAKWCESALVCKCGACAFYCRTVSSIVCTCTKRKPIFFLCIFLLHLNAILHKSRPSLRRRWCCCWCTYPVHAHHMCALVWLTYSHSHGRYVMAVSCVRMWHFGMSHMNGTIIM